MSVGWSDEVDEILGGDLTAGFAYLTPAKGVVIAPMAPLGLRNREAGTVIFTTSLGLWKKLERIRRNPGVAVAYHAREHGLTDRPGFVLVQGRAAFSSMPDRAWLESITPEWDRFLGPRSGGLVGRMLDAYYWQRVGITITVERITAYPDDAASKEAEVFGSAPAPASAAQAAPRGGTEPRVDPSRVAAHARRLPHTLLGWCGSDAMPTVVPVSVVEAGQDGVRLGVPPGSIPKGGRRAGLTSHRFRPRLIGQEQRIYTGWIAKEGSRPVLYSPHTKAGYRLPPSKTLNTLACATLATRMGAARRAGVAPPATG